MNEVGTTLVEFTKDLVLSSVQRTDQGLYQCITSNSVGERSAFIGLVIEAEIDSVITNLKVTVDHKNLKWHLPATMDYLDADRSVFLLNYYLSDGGSANNVPLRNAHCTPDNWCIAKCCSANYVFIPRRNYTFQMSLLQMDTVGKISPLSEHVTALSWDGVSQKAMELSISNPSEHTVEISWNHPSTDVTNGIVQKYLLEYYKDSAHERDVKRKDISLNSTTCLLHNMESNAVYRFRVIPVTRNGLPSRVYLKSNPNFTFIGYMVDSTIKNFNRGTGSLPFDIKQKGITITVNWNKMQDLSVNGTNHGTNRNLAVAIRYARSDIYPLREEVEETSVMSGAIILNANFNLSRVYQFCSRLYDGIFHGPDFCRIYRLLPISGNQLYSEIAVSTDGLPSPVLCDNHEMKCRCESSFEFGDAMRVIWDWPVDDYSADEFVVHYILSESILPEDDRLVITDKAFADLPNLRSNTTYRLMIEARNKLGGVDGSWFDCTTPTLKQIPAPTGVEYEELNATTVRVSWNPIHPNPHWSTPVGYVIQIQSSSSFLGSVKDISVDGMSATNYVITLEPDAFYTFQVAARSSSGDLGLRSSPYLFTPSNINKSSSVTGYGEIGVKRLKTLTLESAQGVLVGTIVVMGLLTLCFGGICAYLRIKRRKLEVALSFIATNSRGVNTSNINNTNVRVLLVCRSELVLTEFDLACKYEMEELIKRQRSGMIDGIESKCMKKYTSNGYLVLHQLNRNNNLSSEEGELYLDTKGGEQGAFPSGQDKYLKLLKDRNQMQQLKEFVFLTEQKPVKSPISCRKNSVGITERRNRLAISASNQERLDSKWIPVASPTSDPWTSNLLSKKQMTYSDSRKTSTRNLNSSRTLMNSCNDGVTAPHFLSKLIVLSDVTRRNTASHVERMDSSTSIICSRSVSEQSSCKQNGVIKKRNDSVEMETQIKTSPVQNLCNTTSSQSLTWYDAASVENGSIIRQPQDAVRNVYTTINKGISSCYSSMPNLTDSGIVYDEIHPYSLPPYPSPPPVNSKQIER
ncbi:unnamed protein product [Thelazia callipaeda]|uniref:Fibronectin type-III domain-containing protein n=1 Tax=Thelazia callipaeda TaxID=103827 RepID=A0A0N5CMK4_THECL|nr:unnamed protein product [Thelazia callipaeda]